ncbi:hypothetical protein DACRYDRAFT_23069 [Dacryopinax primogenitus]|uniref:Uncharacterized protein n=1 Tax=Dacryopinax primogenitus (strain DJM 731) TaxID=1858805 RepID=M5FWF6_DACPD|nr:uncharacterized protein DACRYDRAFT_23069 [Dacryopinax primogenitus]EJU00694.1 hypothetical protein DACRYDRAFT_23069 [Dacryopinax primogenitus]
MVRSLAIVFFLLFSALCGSVSAASLERAKRLTNAARFQAGLPPLPPSKRESGVQPRWSSSAPNSCPGKTYVSIWKSGQKFAHLGKHVNATTGRFDVITTAPNQGSYLEVQTTFDSAAHDFKLTNTDSTYSYLGLADPTNGSISELGYAYLVATAQTAAGAKPTKVGDSRTASNPDSVSESAIWSVTSTKGFYPIFVNSDGTKTSGQGVVKQLSSGYEIEFVGDWELFSQSSAGKDFDKADFYIECAW